MTEIHITLSSDYGYVVIVAAILALQCVLFGGLFPGRLRKKYFNQQFMKEKFSEIHAAELREQITSGGYPDMGCGRYSQLLSYAEWYIFNSAQRAHLNFVENIASILFAVTFGGLYYPLVEIGFGLAIAVGRLIYALGYSTKGPKGRSIGAALSAIGLLGSISLCITTGIKIIQGYSPGSPN